MFWLPEWDADRSCKRNKIRFFDSSWIRVRPGNEDVLEGSNVVDGVLWNDGNAVREYFRKPAMKIPMKFRRNYETISESAKEVKEGGNAAVKHGFRIPRYLSVVIFVSREN